MAYVGFDMAEYMTRRLGVALTALKGGSMDMVCRMMQNTPSLLTHADPDGRTILLEIVAGGNAHVSAFHTMIDILRQDRRLAIDEMAAKVLPAIVSADAHLLLIALIDAGMSPDTRYGNAIPLIDAAVCHDAKRCVRALVARGAKHDSQQALVARAFALDDIAQTLEARSAPLVIPAQPINTVDMMSSSPMVDRGDARDIATTDARWSVASSDDIKSSDETRLSFAIRADQSVEPREASDAKDVQLPAQARREIAKLEEGVRSMGRMLAGKRRSRPPARYHDN